MCMCVHIPSPQKNPNNNKSQTNKNKQTQNPHKIKTQIFSLPPNSPEMQELQRIEFIDVQVRRKVPSAPSLTAAVPVPDLHAVLLLGDGVDPVVGLAAVPVVVVEGRAVRPLEVTLLAQGEAAGAGQRWQTRVPLPSSPRPRPHPTARGRGEGVLPPSKGQTAHLGFTAENLP